jgi:hypothetical protein
MKETPMNTTMNTARTTTRHRLAAALVVATLAPTAALLTAGNASASGGGGDEVINRGSCSGNTHWKLKAKSRDSRIEVEAEIDSNVNGQSWSWKLFHEDSVSARGTSTTQAPSGSFSVSRRTTDLAGTDHFRFRAVNPATDEVCVARVAL